ncbi:MAG: thermonuclease family protein [Eubacteriales bacterium]|nr:thermonuclease family protein [Eubacteriales bacterium]
MLLFGAGYAAPQELGIPFFSSDSDTRHSDLERITLERVVDGDTVYATLNGVSTKIRLIGINTPESVAADESRNTAEGVIASDYVKGLLSKGDVLYLEYDEEQTDQYGRTLAYLWLSDEVNTSSYQDFCKYNLNAVILQNTWCDTMFYAPNYKYRDWLTKLKRQKES